GRVEGPWQRRRPRNRPAGGAFVVSGLPAPPCSEITPRGGAALRASEAEASHRRSERRGLLLRPEELRPIVHDPGRFTKALEPAPEPLLLDLGDDLRALHLALRLPGRPVRLDRKSTRLN